MEKEDSAMKKGVIIYVVGEESGLSSEDLAQWVATAGIDADKVEIVSKYSGHFDVHDAWWALVAKGISHISCVMAEFIGTEGLRLTGREMRLCG
jgi:hypothetical protein